MKKTKLAILISGNGSNLEVLIKSCLKNDFPAEISLVISNNKDALGLRIAQNHNIKTEIIEHKSFKDRESFDEELSKAIMHYNCELICLAGFMRILGCNFINKWQNRIINIHPSLLPSFKGGNAIDDALKYGVKFSGCTVHFVNEEVDSGLIIEQEVVKVLKGDTKETLAKRILEKEHIIYSKALKKICKEI